jgi:hypothetical protein
MPAVNGVHTGSVNANGVTNGANEVNVNGEINGVNGSGAHLSSEKSSVSVQPYGKRRCELFVWARAFLAST